MSQFIVEKSTSLSIKFADHSWWKVSWVGGVVDTVQADEGIVIAHDSVEERLE